MQRGVLRTPLQTVSGPRVLQGTVLALILPGVVTLGWRGCSVGALTAAETSRLCVSSYSICEWPLYLLII